MSDPNAQEMAEANSISGIPVLRAFSMPPKFMGVPSPVGLLIVLCIIAVNTPLIVALELPMILLAIPVPIYVYIMIRTTRDPQLGNLITATLLHPKRARGTKITVTTPEGRTGTARKLTNG